MVGERAILQVPPTIIKQSSKDSPPSWRSPTGAQILPGSRHSLQDSRLVIDKCVQSDSGEYTCTAGTASVKLVLEVRVLPIPPPQPKVAYFFCLFINQCCN